MSVRRTGGGRPSGGSSSVTGSGGVGGASSVKGPGEIEAAEASSGAANSIRAGAAELIKKLKETGGVGFDRHRQELAQGVIKYFGEMLEEDPEMFKRFFEGPEDSSDDGSAT
ncbi:MAG: hypothetical protein A3I75_07045 [Deltaproteobacteria bacterium RIFCSPLOWO2_02_FULL_50_16]|nr:MAG: hypothetical protein A2053_00575 [Deltaproteobacteria bacterium GWA2_50_8]OGQ26982.1 MAG: hypothetical protein A3B79_03220 [Deltaproteobacteria bacterium RIFCSPHIGHO2_02_FULL_50_15]OGQ56478.1 MAG: hypothetical protein A3I75_07045 [Deltaproteobacteria bacterium RIFCSPLOWO2_02_FULL_50_16]OGQ68917.1 MAG: hypothetical protein A3F89_02725 [Deltaproteobacteria bacterium RIFCSPLOWO2_12_FULL_50_11]